MVILDERLQIGTGSSRSVYIHPDDPGLCIKVQHKPVKGRRSRLLPWQRVPLPDNNARELTGYRDVANKLSHRPDLLIRVYGLVDTNKGQGLIVENAAPGVIRSFSLRSLIRRPHAYPAGEAANLLERYDDLACELLTHNVFNHCIRAESILFIESASGFRIKLIDYKTLVERTFVPLERLPRMQRRTVAGILEANRAGLTAALAEC